MPRKPVGTAKGTEKRDGNDPEQFMRAAMRPKSGFCTASLDRMDTFVERFLATTRKRLFRYAGLFEPFGAVTETDLANLERVVCHVSQHMKAAVALALSLIPAIGATVEAPARFELFGHFDNVVSHDRGEHCGGYSLDLWNADGRLIGLLHEHSGLCGDPPCAVIDSAMFDARTRRLQFKTVIGSRKITFAGSVRGQFVSGALNGRPIRLKREASRADTFDPDTNARAWCAFWESVPRCTGVKELCSTLH